ncbi:MAG: endopeptidase La [Bacteroidales bacterium]
MKKNLMDLSDLIENDAEAEFIPLLTGDDELHLNKVAIPDDLPILPIRNNVLFPGMVLPITVGRNKSIQLIKEAYKEKQPIGVVAQRNKESEDPLLVDLYQVGTMATIMKTLQMPDGSTTIIIQGQRKIKIHELVQTEPYLKAKVSALDDTVLKIDKVAFDALLDSLKDLFLQMVKLSSRIPMESSFAINNIDSPNFLIHFMASGLDIPAQEKQKILELEDASDRAYLVMSLMSREMQAMELRQQIQHKVKNDLDKQQRDFILNQQLKTIQEELGGNSGEQEIQELKQKASEKKWTPELAQIFDKELKKLQRTNAMSPDYGIQLNYLNVIIDLPWNEYTPDQFNLKKAKAVLDREHFGLDKVKERILEHLAVLKLRGDMKAPILCLYGPPGVGKTSLGRSIAEALGRKYVRVSLGGLQDESEIRGHRKTYIGAMPGRIIQNIKKAQSSNPVFMLDEIDKVLGMNINGDPSAALLEVLDPEQNTSFHDNFLEIDYDLSKVLFIATANTLSNIHPALLDRMEIIEVTGYIIEEKLQIAKRHLIPKQLKNHGIEEGQLVFLDAGLKYLIENYTRESGVRQLEKQIATIIRSKARAIVEKNKNTFTQVGEEEVRRILGTETARHAQALDTSMQGVVTGLAWTSAGGEILFIEASTSPGKGNLSMTGSLGDVMKESANLAFEYLKAHTQELGLKDEEIQNQNIHIHVPEGATPKDGPSAGIAIFTALVSAYTGQKIKANVAMTGEITLRGQVLPVGGIREKILAAKRAHIHQIILCNANKAQIDEIPKEYIKGLSINYIDSMMQVLAFAMDEKIKKNKKK